MAGAVAVVAAGLVALSPGAVDSALAVSGTAIEGTVRADGQPGGIPGVAVHLQDYYGYINRSTTTDASGHYEFNYLSTNYTYEMWFTPLGTPLWDEGYIWQGYDNLEDFSQQSTLIFLDPGQDFVANATLHLGGTIAGRVTDSATGAPVVGERVSAGDSAAVTAADGSYAIKGLMPGTYTVGIDQVDSSGQAVANPTYANQWWNGQPTQDTASPITVGLGQSATANFSTPRGSSFAGRITGPNGTALAGTAYVYGADSGVLLAMAYADSDGQWVVGGLLPGTYKIGIVGVGQPISPSVIGRRGGGAVAATFAGDVKVTALSSGGGVAAKDLRSSYPYASQWYSGHTSFATAHMFTISKPDTHVTGLDEQLPWDQSAINQQAWSGENTGGSNLSEPRCPCSHGDPVNTSNGEFFLNSTDLSEPGVGPAVRLTRSYSSTAAGGWGTFGPGTSSNLSMGLRPNQYVNGIATKVGVVQENGSMVWFTWNGAGYIAPTRVQASLAVDGQGDYVFTRGGTSRFTFRPDGPLISQSDLNGNTVQYGYDEVGRPVSITGSGGRRIDLTWTDEGFLTRAADQAGRTVTYGYDQNGGLTSVADPAGNVTSYGYDNDEELTSITKPGGGTTTNTYAGGMVVAQSDPMGGVTSFSYEGASWGSMQATTTLPSGQQIVEVFDQGLLQSRTTVAGTKRAATTGYSYDDAQNLTKVTNAMGHTTAYGYDSRGNVTRVRQPLGQVTRHTYDDLRDVTSTTDPLGQTTAYSYDAAGNKTGQTNPDATSASWTYNPDGTVSSLSDPLGHVTGYTYDPAGNLASTTDPNHHTTAIAYNGAEQVVATSTPSGATTTYTLDQDGRVLTTTSPSGRVSAFTYDADGNLTSVTDPAGHATRYKYNLSDQKTQQVDPDHDVTRYGYDTAGHLDKVVAPGGGVTRYEYDLAGRQSGTIDPDGNRTAVHYNLDGLQTAIYQPDRTYSTTSYDANGNKTATTDFAGHTTSYAYDSDGRLSSTTDPIGRVTTYAYTPTGKTAQVTLPDGSTQTYTYDKDGNQTKYVNPDGAVTTYAYTLSGQAKSQTVPGGATTGYTYTADGQLRTTTKPDGTTATSSYTLDGQLKLVHYSQPGTADTRYTYTVSGQRKTMTDASGTTSYTYDPAGRATSVTDGASNTVGYGYDPDGNLTALTYPGGRQASYTYDLANRMTAVSDWSGNTTAFAWTPNGNLATQTDANGLTETFSYDPNGNTTDITAASSSGTLADFSYGYDSTSQLISQTSTDPAGTNASTYAHDPIGQLAVQTDSTTSANTAYSATPGGALTSLGATTLTYNTAQQVVTATSPASASTYGYNADGQRTSATTGTTTATYTYDPAGNLLSVTTPEATVGYTSNGQGLRVSRTTGQTSQQFTWDTQAAIALLLDDGEHAYLYGPSTTPIAQIDDTSGDVQYLSADNIGSVRLITDAQANPIGASDYDAYGTTTATSGTASSHIGYTGNWTDPLTGLLYLRARYYDPSTAQFLSRDPLEAQTGAPYSYAANDPINGSDPSGLCNANPFSGSFWGTGNCISDYAQYVGLGQVKSAASCAGAGGNSVYDCAVMNLDPAYLAIQGYTNEWQDAENNCSGFTIFKDGAQAVAGVAGTASLAVGGATAAAFAGEGAAVGGAAADTGTALVKYDADFAVGQLTADGRATASQLDEFGASQGWVRSQTETGPVKYTDGNGVVRLTIKQGSPRAPGSGGPHVELRNPDGTRIDPFGNPVSRTSPGNHTPIVWDW